MEGAETTYSLLPRSLFLRAAARDVARRIPAAVVCAADALVRLDRSGAGTQAGYDIAPRFRCCTGGVPAVPPGSALPRNPPRPAPARVSRGQRLRTCMQRTRAIGLEQVTHAVILRMGIVVLDE